jgi:hypothetical protein
MCARAQNTSEHQESAELRRMPKRRSSQNSSPTFVNKDKRKDRGCSTPQPSHTPYTGIRTHRHPSLGSQSQICPDGHAHSPRPHAPSGGRSGQIGAHSPVTGEQPVPCGHAHSPVTHPSCPCGHTHAPPAQTSAAEQTLEHCPQLFASDCRLTHRPRHFTRPVGQLPFPGAGAAQAIPGTAANAPPMRAAPIHLSALPLDTVPLASPLASSSKELSLVSLAIGHLLP